MDTEQMIDTILEHIFNINDDSVQLKLGIWSYDEDPHNFYAVIESERDNLLLAGETTYGSETMNEALSDLIKEL